MKFVLSILFLLAPAYAASSELSKATKLYHATDYDGALRVLQSAPDAKRDGDFQLLAGKAYYMKGEFKKASDAFERAVQQNPANSDYQHWLGRAMGRRAESASFVTAPGYASKARQCFEKAVQLNPQNMEAVNDLFEYYKEAPGILGGGLDKAQELVSGIKQSDPAEYHFALAQLAEKRKEYSFAEQQLRKALELAPRQVGRFIDLARFLAKRGRYQESDALFLKAEAIAPNEPKLLFAKANTYIQTKRNLEEARELLKKYLESPLTPEEPSREDARKLLAKVAGGI